MANTKGIYNQKIKEYAELGNNIDTHDRQMIYQAAIIAEAIKESADMICKKLEDVSK